MRRASASTFAAAVLFGTAVTAAPQGGPPVEYEAPPLPSRTFVDPLDGTRFEASTVPAANGLGGWDGDGCTYSRGVQPRALSVITSPSSLYSARAEHWERPMTVKQRDALLALLSASGAHVEQASSLPAFRKYELAAQVGAFFGDRPEKLGELYLIGAWTVRDSIVGFMPSIQGTGDAWSKLQIVAAQARQLRDDSIRTRAMFDIARLCHRGGFLVERDEFLTLLDGIPDQGLGAVQKREEFYLRVLDESRLLSRARELFRLALEQKDAAPVDRADWRWLLGEIARRLGDWDEARARLTSVTEDPAAREETRGYARDILSVLAVQATAPRGAR